MPATYTHHIFTKDVFKTLPSSITHSFQDEINLFFLFGKSFDILFFSKYQLASFAHKNFVNLYFKNIIQYMRENHFIHNQKALAYLYGSICHYVMDSTIHPFVYYHTGLYNSKDKLTRKYLGEHDRMEYMIDAILYQERNHKKIYQANMKKEVFSKVFFTPEFNLLLDTVFFRTFQVSHGSKSIRKGYFHYQFIVKHVMTSRFGIKKFFFFLFDQIPIKKSFKIFNHSYHIKKIDKSVLNLEHHKWCYPVDKKITYHYSFYDLYDIAIIRARTLIMHLDEALNRDEKEINKVLKEIGNNSYATGLDANKYSQMKYFLY